MSSTLITGQSYDVDSLQLVGWTDGDGSGHEGYEFADYFENGHEYLGADEHGIEPIFAEAVPARSKGIKIITINSECGVMDFGGEDIDIEAAKDAYSKKTGYDFDGYAEHPGSWYFVNVDGAPVEAHTENMPN